MNRLMWTIVPMVAAGVLATTGTPAAATACHLTYLPLPDGATRAYVTEGEVTGRYAVGYAFIDGVSTSVIWRDGVPSVPSLPFGEGRLTDVNSTGVAIGYGVSMDGRSSAVTWNPDGGLYILPGPDGDWSVQAVATNERGDIVGTATSPSSADSKITVLWRAGTDTIETLPYDDATFAVDIDEDGTVLAQSGTWVSSGPALLWQAATGEVRSLGDGSAGTAIRGGHVTGWRNTASGAETVRWSPDGTAEVVPAVGMALTVTSSGTVAGLGPSVARADGTVITVEAPLRNVGIEYLADDGTAYGYAGTRPARWTGCR